MTATELLQVANAIEPDPDKFRQILRVARIERDRIAARKRLANLRDRLTTDVDQTTTNVQALVNRFEAEIAKAEDGEEMTNLPTQAEEDAAF